MRVIIDGPSGAGKTALASQLAEGGFFVLHLDDWYPDWDGLAEGSRITERLLTGRALFYPHWDWELHRATGRVFPPLNRPLIIEGCGALTPVSRRECDLAIWVEATPEVAKHRGLARDGAAFAPYWDQWHRQEQEHWRVNHPRDLADWILRTDEL